MFSPKFFYYQNFTGNSISSIQIITKIIIKGLDAECECWVEGSSFSETLVAGGVARRGTKTVMKELGTQ